MERTCNIIYDEEESKVCIYIQCQSAESPISQNLISSLNFEVNLRSDDYIELTIYHEKAQNFRKLFNKTADECNITFFTLVMTQDKLLKCLEKMLSSNDIDYKLKCPLETIRKSKHFHNNNGFYFSPGKCLAIEASSDFNSNNINLLTWNKSLYDGSDNEVESFTQMLNGGCDKSEEIQLTPEFLGLFPADALYFLIKPFETKNIMIAMQQRCWNFAAQTEKKLFKYFGQGFRILLVFTVRGSKQFHGVAELVNTNCGVPNHPCPIKWLTQNILPYEAVKSFIHPKLHLKEDGVQFEKLAGMKLCKQIYIAMGSNSNERPVLGRKKNAPKMDHK